MSFSKKRSAINDKGEKLLRRQDLFLVLVDEISPNGRIQDSSIFENNPDVKRKVDFYQGLFLSDYKNKIVTVPPLSIESNDSGFTILDSNIILHALHCANNELSKTGERIEYISAREVKTSDTKATRLVILNSATKDALTPLEEAEIISLLKHDNKMSIAEIANQTGKVPARVYQLLQTANLPEQLKQDIQSGICSAKKAIKSIAKKQKRLTHAQKELEIKKEIELLLSSNLKDSPEDLTLSIVNKLKEKGLI